MIPVHVLSGDDAPERLVAIWADAERLGIAISRVGARSVEGLAPAERAVAVAENHRRAWTRIADGDAPFAAVLTDNVALGEPLLPLLSREFLARSLPPRSVLVLDAGAGLEEATGPARIVRPVAPPAGFRAYIISRVAVRQLLAGDAASGPLDRVLARRRDHGIETFLVLPAPVSSEGGAETGETDGANWAPSRVAAWGRNLMTRLAPRDSTLFEPIPVPTPEGGKPS